MGRKPKTLITRHFNRGAKLPDNSNRYSHSCKHCAENFPRGRTDTLEKHITKDCPVVSPVDRSEAIRELNGLNSLGLDGAADDIPSNLGKRSAITREGGSLYALADAALIGIGGAAAGQGTDEPRAKRLKLTESYSLDHPPPNLDGPSSPRGRGNRGGKGNKSRAGAGDKSSTRNNTSPSGFVATGHSLENGDLSIQTNSDIALDPAFTGGGYETSYTFTNPEQQRQMDDGHPTVIDPNLQEIEAAAIVNPGFFEQAQNGRIEQPEWSSETIPGDFHNEQYSNEPGSDQFYETPTPRQLQQGYNNAVYSTTPAGPAPTAEFNAESGNGRRVTKQKLRGKFEDSRKREVRVLRTIGACVRCRMLKKSCSPGTPCDACLSIEDARVWKLECTRDRLDSALFQLKSGVNSSLAYKDNIATLRESPPLDRSMAIIDVSQFPEEVIFISFTSCCVTATPAVVDHESNIAGLPTTITEVFILEHELDDVPTKMNEYMVQVLARKQIINRESSRFIQAVLQAAIDLSQTSDIAKLALRMFTVVSILLDEKLTWSMSNRAEEDLPGSGTLIPPNSESYRLVELQLKAAAEKKAGDLVEKIAGTIDRQLLKADSKQRFDFFIVGLLLLIILEKVTWDFTKWEQGHKQPYTWPLSAKSPSIFVHQRIHVVKLLNTLLRIREIPPPTETDDNGVLFTRRNDESRVFYKQLQLSEQQVLQRFEMNLSDAYDRTNSRCFEMTLCAWLILPEKLLPKTDKPNREKSVSK